MSSDVTIVVFGDAVNEENGSNAGQVRVYQWNGTDTWTQLGSDIDGDEEFDRLGDCVSLSGDGSRLAIGATRNDGNGSNAGRVRVYNYIPPRTIHHLEGIVRNWGNDGRSFGYSVGIDGNYAIVGAPEDDYPSGDSGSAFIYDVSTGAELHKLIGTGVGEAHRFGYSVAISGNNAIVGAVY